MKNEMNIKKASIKMTDGSVVKLDKIKETGLNISDEFLGISTEGGSFWETKTYLFNKAQIMYMIFDEEE